MPQFQFKFSLRADTKADNNIAVDLRNFINKELALGFEEDAVLPVSHTFEIDDVDFNTQFELFADTQADAEARIDRMEKALKQAFFPDVDVKTSYKLLNPA